MFNRNTVHGQVAYWLMVIGGLNWGLVGIGSFFNMNLNVVNLALGSIPYADVSEPIVYILVGLAAIMGIFGCRCTSCAVHMDAKPM